MKTFTRIETYNAPPGKVFDCIDDLGVTGTHMTKSNAMMMGSKLKLEFITPNKKGPGTLYRWTGTMMGMAMDFTVKVTQWTAGSEKTWETIGDTKLIIYSWYRMHLKVQPIPEGAFAELSISYQPPAGRFNQIISFVFAGWYCRWCLKKMLGDAKRYLHQLTEQHVLNAI